MIWNLLFRMARIWLWHICEHVFHSLCGKCKNFRAKTCPMQTSQETWKFTKKHNLTLGCLYDVYQHWKSRINSNSWSWLTFGLVHCRRLEEEGKKLFRGWTGLHLQTEWGKRSTYYGGSFSRKSQKNLDLYDKKSPAQGTWSNLSTIKTYKPWSPY